MIPVEQSRFEAHNGDCHAACLASILEIALEAVPKPSPGELADSEGWTGYLERLREEVLHPRGLHDLNIAAHTADTGDAWRPPGYAIGCAVSPRTGGYHAFVALDGEVVWDPHPQRAMGLGECREWAVFVTLDPARHKGENNG